VVEAANGAEALETLDDGAEVDLVLLDLSMPGMDGVETARRIRERSPQMPIVLSTGHGDPAVVAGEPEFDFALLRKPYRQALLVARVAELLGSRRGEPDEEMDSSPPGAGSLARGPSR
jgi:CheY-like chemotaxis protein